jgi:predicted metal-dependent phosphotriesterase family hydrolase
VSRPRCLAPAVTLSEDDKRRTRPLWRYNHIADDILPALRKAVKEDQIEQMLVRNPRAIFEARRTTALGS